MDIQVTEKSVRAMAERLRIAASVSQSKALETLAVTLGYKNWDTLNGVLKKEAIPAKPAFVVKESVELFVRAFPTSEFGEAPPWAKLLVSQSFVDKLLGLQALCVQNGLSETEVSWYPESWGEPAESGSYYNMRDPHLVVGKSSWWLTAYPKHCDYTVETRILSIETLLSVLSRKDTSSDRLVWYKGSLVYDECGKPDVFIDELKDFGVL